MTMIYGGVDVMMMICDGADMLIMIYVDMMMLCRLTMATIPKAAGTRWRRY